MPVKIDLHVHTKYSVDAAIEPKKLVRVALKRGLDAVAVTDHNTLKGAFETKGCGEGKLIVVVGEEIDTDRGEVIGLFLEEKVEKGSLPEVTDKIREQAGIVVLPHPFDSFRKSSMHPTDSESSYFDLVEGLNARCIRAKHNLMAQRYAVRNGKKMTAGSDAHISIEIGKVYTQTETENIREDLLKGKTMFFGGRTTPLVHALTFLIKIFK